MAAYDDIGARFRAAWSDTDPATATPELLPLRLARATAAVLPVTAAGMSLFDHEFRVPLGSSDETAANAERLQFTHGAGPCLEAGTRGVALSVDMTEMTRRWPAFAADLAGQTPYRAIVSLPLHVGVTVSGAVNLYLGPADDVAALRVTDVATVVTQVTDALVAAQTVPTALTSDAVVDAPSWLAAPASRNRSQVWIALGMVMTARGVNADDALALLRSFAYGHGTVLDDLARDLLQGRVRIDEIAV